MNGFPVLRYLWKDLVVGLPDDVSAFKSIIRQPALADGEVVHLVIEHGEGSRRMFDKQTQSVLAYEQRHFGLLALGDVFRDAGLADHFTLLVADGKSTVVNPVGLSSRKDDPVFEIVILR